MQINVVYSQIYANIYLSKATKPLTQTKQNYENKERHTTNEEHNLERKANEKN